MGKYWARGQNDKRSSLKSVWSVDSLFTTIAYSNIQKLLQVKLKFPSRKKNVTQTYVMAEKYTW